VKIEEAIVDGGFVTAFTMNLRVYGTLVLLLDRVLIVAIRF